MHGHRCFSHLIPKRRNRDLPFVCSPQASHAVSVPKGETIPPPQYKLEKGVLSLFLILQTLNGFVETEEEA